MTLACDAALCLPSNVRHQKAKVNGMRVPGDFLSLIRLRPMSAWMVLWDDLVKKMIARRTMCKVYEAKQFESHISITSADNPYAENSDA